MKKSPSPTWFTEVSSPLGSITLTATDAGLSGLYFDQQRWFPSDAIRATWLPAKKDDPRFQPARIWLRDFFAGKSPAFTGPLDPHGTAFQQSVWKELLTIEPGETSTYATVAGRVGNPKGVRAVGAAIGRNPISLIIPCHRVVGTGGSLTGYAGGLDRKQRLLELERKK